MQNVSLSALLLMKAIIQSKRKLSHIWSEFAQYVVEYTRIDGRVEQQIREMHDTGNGAAILLYDLPHRKIVLIKQFRLAAMINENGDGVLYEVCAGLVENNDPKATIIKEVKEETGFQISDPKYLFSAFATPGAKTEKIHFFTSPVNTEAIENKGGGMEEEQEDIEVVIMPFDEAWAMVKDGTIRDLKTIALLMHAKMEVFK